MAANRSKSLPAVGFLTVWEHPEHGLFGGYLVLNAAGRPLEFHCTAPVRPNRAQQILYGPTLKPFLYGEQIGQALVSKAKTPVLMICTDVEPALALREHVLEPVVLVEPAGGSGVEGGERAYRVDTAHALPPASMGLVRFAAAGQRLAVPAAFAADQQDVVDRWQPHASGLDLLEPFARIREAIEEAQPNARS